MRSQKNALSTRAFYKSYLIDVAISIRCCNIHSMLQYPNSMLKYPFDVAISKLVLQYLIDVAIPNRCCNIYSLLIFRFKCCYPILFYFYFDCCSIHLGKNASSYPLCVRKYVICDGCYLICFIVICYVFDNFMFSTCHLFFNHRL